jgi:putative membrane protein
MKKFKEFIVYTVKGFVIGIANVIPGVSGGTLALVLGIYEKLIGAISHIRKQFKESCGILIPILIGIVLAFLSMSHVVTYCLENYLFATVLFFFGAVLGGLPMLFKKIKTEKVKPAHILIFVITFAVVFLLLFAGAGNDVSLAHLNIGKLLLLVLIGAVASATMVVPGVSGSAFLMTIGYYYPVMNEVKNLTVSGSDKGHAFAILIPFGIGVIIGIVLISKLIEFLLKKYEIKTYWGIIGFVIASALVIIMQNFFMVDGAIGVATALKNTHVAEYIIGVVLAIGGYIVTYKFGDSDSDDEKTDETKTEVTK